MSETSVRLMGHAVCERGLLKIGSIGAGVGVIIYSPASRIGAGVHVLAPHSGPRSPDNPAMYANTAIPLVLDELKELEAQTPFSVALVGGATLMNRPRMASTGSKPEAPGKQALIDGNETVTAVKNALSVADARIKIEETGGSQVRSIVLDVDGGKIKVT